MADAPHGYRVLVVAPFPPQLNGRHGGSRAIANLVTALARHNRVALAYLRADDEPPAGNDVISACERVHEERRSGISTSAVRPWPRAFVSLLGVVAGRPLWVAARWSPGFARAVREMADAWHPDVVQAEFTAMAPYLKAVSGVPRIVVVHEPAVPTASQRIAESAGVARALWRLDARHWRQFERAMVRDADVAVVYTEEDRVEIEGLGTRTPVSRIPLAIAIPSEPCDPAEEHPRRILFVGNFVHPPNVDAAIHLARDLFPRLRDLVPEVTIQIVGEGPPAELLALAGDSIEITGWVPDLSAYLRAAAVVVAPLRLGRGMRVKVAEAMALGKAVAGSSLAFAGMPVTSGLHAIVTNSEQEFATDVAALLHNPRRRGEMGAAARQLAVATLGLQATADAYGALYDWLRKSALQ